MLMRVARRYNVENRHMGGRVVERLGETVSVTIANIVTTTPALPIGQSRLGTAMAELEMIELSAILKDELGAASFLLRHGYPSMMSSS